MRTVKLTLKTFLFSLFIISFSLLTADERNYEYSPIEIDVVDDTGRLLNQYAVHSDKAKIHRAYLEAIKNKRYQLRIRNNSDRRVGLVIAVDGRNILNGSKSYLGSNERMYVLDPYETSYYKGWRTAQNQINRFYFTSANDSYADTWGDRSAMGVIAVAVFNEKHQPRYKNHNRLQERSAPSSRGYSLDDSTGTGFGKEEYSPSINVRFKAQKQPSSKHFYKYEWRNTLCDKGIIHCGRYVPRKHNRFWPYEANNGYAPYPPNHQNKNWSDQFTRSWKYDYNNRGW